MAHRGGNRLPAHADAHFHALRCAAQCVAALDALFQRHAAAVFHLILTIVPRHVRIGRARHAVVDDHDILIRLVAVKEELGTDAVDAALEGHIEARVERLLVHAAEQRVLVFADAADRRCGQPGLEFIIIDLALGELGHDKSAAEVGGVKHIALVPDLRARQIGLDANLVQPRGAELLTRDGHADFCPVFFHNGVHCEDRSLGRVTGYLEFCIHFFFPPKYTKKVI